MLPCSYELRKGVKRALFEHRLENHTTARRDRVESGPLYTRVSVPHYCIPILKGPQMPPEYFFPILGMGFALCWGLIGTARWYLKERLRAESRHDSLSGDDVELVHALQERVAELEERVDFHERLISQQRKELG